jgi:putative ABC transport system ATP-binding protein/lipoprotein-releasing system ATP-binding protein
MVDPLVEAHGLSRSYRAGDETVIAVANADCTIRPGARIALAGRSGSGKSTLLQMLGGIETPSAGTIAWPALGARETLRPHNIAFVFQRESLIEALSVLENVALPLSLDGVTPGDATKRALEGLARFDLAELAEKLPEELSGGQQQRVAFARALTQHPRLILADEPTGQLDSATADRLFAVALPLLEETSTAIVVATHDLRLAALMPVQWRMERGRLEGAS